MKAIDELELVLVGPNVYHAWFTHQCLSKSITEVTIQFHKDLFDDKFLRRNQLSFVKNMMERSQRGILFSQDTVNAVKERISRSIKKAASIPCLSCCQSCTIFLFRCNMKTLSDSQFFQRTISLQ